MVSDKPQKADPRKDRDFVIEPAGNRVVSWTPASALPDPDPREGFHHGWIRVEAYGQPDPRNMNTRIREGWEPCRAEDYPEIVEVLMPNSVRNQNTPARNQDVSTSGNIIIGGLMLCRMPDEIWRAREAYLNKQAQNQMTAVENDYLREQNPNMPKIREGRTKVTFGSSGKDD